MAQIVIIGIGAGVAAALLVASPLASLFSGASVGLAVLLGSIAPLPILIAAIGWSHWAGLIATGVGAAVLALALSGVLFLPFLIGVGLPAWWLSYLALLARPAAARPLPAQGQLTTPALPEAAAPADDHMEWYPVGRLVVWAALLATAVVTATLLNIGLDAETIRSGLRQSFEKVMRLQMQIPADAPLDVPGLSDPNRLLDVFAILFPTATAVFTTIVTLINLWLAARIVKISGRLRRPWPDLAAISFPPAVAALLAAAIAAGFLPNLIGLIAGVLSATLLTAYAALGFAVLHKITGGMLGRGFVLAGAYAAVGVLGWPVLVMTLLGLADTLLDVRGRVATRRRPSPPDT